MKILIRRQSILKSSKQTVDFTSNSHYNFYAMKELIMHRLKNYIMNVHILIRKYMRVLDGWGLKKEEHLLLINIFKVKENLNN